MALSGPALILQPTTEGSKRGGHQKGLWGPSQGGYRVRGGIFQPSQFVSLQDGAGGSGQAP